MPPRLQTLAMGNASEMLDMIELEGEDFTKSQIQKFTQDPSFYEKFVKVIEKESNASFPMVSD